MGHVNRRSWQAITAAVLAAAAAAGCPRGGALDRGDALLADGRPGEALQAFLEAAAAAPSDTQVLIRIATAQVRLRRFDDAEATMRRAVALEPESPKVLQNLALVYLWRRDLDRALDTFERVRALEETYPETSYYIGLIHEARGDEEAAVRYYVMDVNNGPSPAWERLSHYREKQRALGVAPSGPSSSSLLIFSLACLAVAGAAWALKALFAVGVARPSTEPES